MTATAASIPLHLKKTQTGIVVHVHPVVPLIVCDAFTRRCGRERVLGTILGTVAEKHVYHVTNCFVVPHTESATQVSIDTSHHQTLLDLHLKVYPKDTVLGWFSTNHTLQGVDSLIQEFYSNHVANPIHLAVDAGLENVEEVKVTAHVSRPLHLKGLHIATEFVEVECRVDMQQIEGVDLRLLQSGFIENLKSPPENLMATLNKLIELVEDAHAYVSAVVDGKQKGDAAIGRYLADTLAIVPFVDKDKFKTLFQDRLQELILILYLANLTKSQIAIADKLAAKQP